MQADAIQGLASLPCPSTQVHYVCFNFNFDYLTLNFLQHNFILFCQTDDYQPKQTIKSNHNKINVNISNLKTN